MRHVLPRRHRPGLRRRTPACSRDRIAAALGAGGGRRLAPALAAGRPGLGRRRGGTCCAGRWTARASLAGAGLAAGRPGRDRARPDAARRWAAATCATRGCGCCWTGTPPTPAPTRAGRRPRWLAIPYAELDVRRLVPARRPGHARRRAARPVRARWASPSTSAPPVAAHRRRRRPGRRGAPRRRRRGPPADLVVANADALHVYRDLLPHPRARPRRLADRSLAGFVLLLGVRGTTPALAHHTVFFPPDYDAEFDAVFGRPGRRARPPRRPGRLRHRAPTTRPSARTGTRRGSCWSTRPARHAWPRRLARARAGRGVRATGSSPCWPRAGSTCGTGCCSARSAPRADLDAGDRRPGRRDLRHASHGCRPAPARQPRPGRRACSWSAARPTPAAACPMVTLSAKIVADQIGPAR